MQKGPPGLFFFAQKLAYVIFFVVTSARPFPSFAKQTPGGFPPNFRSRPAAYMQVRLFFCIPLLLSLLIIESLRPRRIRICPVKTVVSAWGSGRKGALGAPVFEGHIRYPNGLKALNNRGIFFRLAKKMFQKLAYMQFLL